MSQTFTVSVNPDQDINLDPENPESLVLGADVEGDALYGPNGSTEDPHQTLAAIPFTDTTPSQITAKTYAEIEMARDAARVAGAGGNALWEPGETLTLMAEQLFNYPETTGVVLGNFVSDDPAALSGSTSGDMVTITAVGATLPEGSPISITATVVGTSSSLEVTQTNATAVTVKFSIAVDQPTITAKDNAQEVADAAVREGGGGLGERDLGAVAERRHGDDRPERSVRRARFHRSQVSDRVVHRHGRPDNQRLHDDGRARSDGGRDGHDHGDGRGYRPAGAGRLR